LRALVVLRHVLGGLVIVHVLPFLFLLLLLVTGVFGLGGTRSLLLSILFLLVDSVGVVCVALLFGGFSLDSGGGG
jgi:small-conductance mechanosensitive channel